MGEILTSQTRMGHFRNLSKPTFPLSLRLLERKVHDPNGPYISTSHTKKILSVDNFEILSVFCFVVVVFCHTTFTKCVSDQYTHFSVSIGQM